MDVTNVEEKVRKAASALKEKAEEVVDDIKEVVDGPTPEQLKIQKQMRQNRQLLALQIRGAKRRPKAKRLSGWQKRNMRVLEQRVKDGA